MRRAGLLVNSKTLEMIAVPISTLEVTRHRAQGLAALADRGQRNDALFLVVYGDPGDRAQTVFGSTGATGLFHIG